MGIGNSEKKLVLGGVILFISIFLIIIKFLWNFNKIRWLDLMDAQLIGVIGTLLMLKLQLISFININSKECSGTFYF